MSRFERGKKRRRNEARNRRRADYCRLRSRTKRYRPLWTRIQKAEQGGADITVVAPPDFSLVENPEGTLAVLRKVDRLRRRVRTVQINMDDVQKICVGTILMLVHVMGDDDEGRPRMGKVSTTVPKNQAVVEAICRSGAMASRSASWLTHDGRPPFGFSDVGRMAEHTGNKVVGEEAKELQDYVLKVWGMDSDARTQETAAAYSVLIEMMSNSYHHAHRRPGCVVWRASASGRDGDDVVRFGFIDHGKGILRSLRLAPRFRVKDYLWIKRLKEESLLQEVVEGKLIKRKALSRTGLQNRGNGFPNIAKELRRGHIHNLVVIANGAIARVDGGGKGDYRRLDGDLSFSGTFLYWELHRPRQEGSNRPGDSGA